MKRVPPATCSPLSLRAPLHCHSCPQCLSLYGMGKRACASCGHVFVTRSNRGDKPVGGTTDGKQRLSTGAAASAASPAASPATVPASAPPPPGAPVAGADAASTTAAATAANAAPASSATAHAPVPAAPDARGDSATAPAARAPAASAGPAALPAHEKPETAPQAVLPVPDELSLQPRRPVNFVSHFYASATEQPQATAVAKAEGGDDAPEAATAATQDQGASAAKAAPGTSRLTLALMEACRRGDIRVICSFLQQGAALTLPAAENSESDRPVAAISEAVTHGHAAATQLLCSHGADPLFRAEPAGPSGVCGGGGGVSKWTLLQIPSPLIHIAPASYPHPSPHALSTPTATRSSALQQGIAAGHWNVVSTLLPFINEDAEERQVAVTAAVRVFSYPPNV